MKHVAFTLIELLVVIAIIAILTAILIPCLQNSRQHAKAVMCGSNIKQLVLGLVTYEIQNGSFPYAFNRPPSGPPPVVYPGFPEYDRQGWWWFNYIEGISNQANRQKTVLWCPSRQIKNSKLRDNVLCSNYGVNRSICKSSDDIQSRREEFVGTPLRSSDIPYPSQTLLIVDSGYSLISWWNVTNIPPVTLNNTIEDTAYLPGIEINKDKNIWPGQEEDAIFGRHPNKTVNVSFVDGHLTRIRADDLFVEKIVDEYKNKSPLWQPK